LDWVKVVWDVKSGLDANLGHFWAFLMALWGYARAEPRSVRAVLCWGFMREPSLTPRCVHIPGWISVRFCTDGNAYRRLGREPRRGRKFGAFLSVLEAIGFVRAHTRTLSPPLLRSHSRVSPSRESLPYPRDAAGVREGFNVRVRSLLYGD